MARLSRWWPALVVGTVLGSAPGRADLPVVAGADFKQLRDDCRRLLRALDSQKAPFPAATQKALRTLLDGRAEDAEVAAEQVQKLLDRRCLVGVTINPESRVKAERGSAAAELPLGREAVFLIKIHNQAGVTQALKITGSQLRGQGKDGRDRWLEAAVLTESPLRKTLSGHVVEYVPLRLVARQEGKREATLVFDVGQGTQDLGFRAEVPVLFRVTR